MKPFVSLIIVFRNEREFLLDAITSLLNQTYSLENLEFIFVDGMSTDGSWEIASTKQLELIEAGVKCKLLRNPKKTLACGWNLAIKEADGEFVCRIDAHGHLDPDYIQHGLDVFHTELDPALVCVGGILENKGEGFWGGIAVDLFSSKFGVGNSPFRIKSDQKFFSDTAAMGIYRKSIFEKVGYFDEALDRNQDIALHQQIILKGFQFITDPAMVFVYNVRSSFASLIKKAYQDGFWVIFSGASYLRHKAPLFFLTYIVVCFFGKFSGFKRGWVWVPMKFYLFLAAIFAVKDGRGKNKVLLPFLFLAYHVVYGIGSLHALFRLFYKKIN